MHWQQGGAGRLPASVPVSGPPTGEQDVQRKLDAGGGRLQSQGGGGGLRSPADPGAASTQRPCVLAACGGSNGLTLVTCCPRAAWPVGRLRLQPCLLTLGGQSGHVARCCPASSPGLGWAAPPPSAPLQRHRRFAKVGRPGPARLVCSGECLETALGVLGFRRSGLPWLLLICSLPLTLLAGQAAMTIRVVSRVGTTLRFELVEIYCAGGHCCQLVGRSK
jgi:hypothetical protein